MLGASVSQRSQKARPACFAHSCGGLMLQLRSTEFRSVLPVGRSSTVRHCLPWRAGVAVGFRVTLSLPRFHVV